MSLVGTQIGRKMSLSNVALSQRSGHEMIWLLCKFDNQMFFKMHDVALLAEDDQMERLDRITKEWWQKMGHDKEQTEIE
jgi:hypothetical protein